MAVVNTSTGPGLFDVLAQQLNERAQNNEQLRGLAAGGIIPASAAPGPSLLSRLLGNDQPQAAAPAMTATPAPVAVSAPAAAAPALPTFAAGVGTPRSQNDNASRALAFFQQKGLSPIASAGLVGGFQRESGPGLNPGAINPSSGATGVGQWNGPRAAALKQFASQNGLDPNDLNTQLEYAWQELNGPERSTLEALQRASNPLQATVAAVGYERPEGWTSQNPGATRDFGKRLQSTVSLAGGTPVQVAGADNSAPPPWYRPTRGPDAPATAPAAPPAAPPASTGTPMPTLQQIQALIRNPQTQQLGLKLWQASLQKPGEAFTLGADQARFDSTGRLIATGPQKPDDYTLKAGETRYRGGNVVASVPDGPGTRTLDPSEFPQYGIPAGTSGPVQVDKDGKLLFPLKPGQQINVDTRAENAEAQARGAGLGKRMNEISEAGTKAGEDAAVVDRLGDLLGTVQTGPKTAALERLRQATGGAISLDPNTDNVQALNAAVQYLAPRLRVPGSGSQSDRELGNFLASVPGLANTPGGNAKILGTLRGMIARKQQAAQIANDWQLGKVSAAEAQQRLDALPSAFTPAADAAPKTVSPKATTIATPAIGAVESGYRFKGGDPAVQANWEKVQ